MYNQIKENLLVSIRLMTYNHAEYIEQALHSIDMQKTNFKFEVVIGDDFSTDGNIEKIKAYQFLNENITVNILERRQGDSYSILREKNGRLHNFLDILNNCRGKYIALLDGDDYWTDPLKLQKQIDFLEANPDFSLCFHNAIIVNEKKNTEKVTIMNQNLDNDIFYTRDLLKQWFIPTASTVFRNYKDFTFPQWFVSCSSGDIALLLLLSLKGPFKYLNEPMSVYRLHHAGISNTHTGYDKVFPMIFLYKNFDIFTNYRFSKEIQNAMIYEIKKHLPELKNAALLEKELKVLKQDWLIKKYLKIKKLF